MAWTAARDYAAARRPAMEAVEVARRVQNPALSAFAFCAAAGAIWPGDPQTALMLIEDSLALTRAGAFDPNSRHRPDVGWLHPGPDRRPAGALDMLQEAMAQQHADGNRLLLGMTLQIAAVALARAGEPLLWCCPEPSRRISRRTSLAFTKTQKMGIGETQSLAHRTLARRGRLQRRARPGRRDGRRRARRLRAGRVPAARRPARTARRAGTRITAGPGAAEPRRNDRVTQAERAPAEWAGQAPRSFQPAPGGRLPGPPRTSPAPPYAACQHCCTELLLTPPSLPHVRDRLAKLDDPELADLREATDREGAGLSRAGSIWLRKRRQSRFTVVHLL